MTIETTLTSDTIPVRETHRFDVDALERYLAQRIPGFHGPIVVSQFQGGQSNPTYRLSAAGHEYVLRRKPPGKLLPSAHAVDREYRILTALGRTDVPVPKTWVLCDDPDVIGTIFYVMDWVAGRIMVDPLLPGCLPAERGAIYDSMSDVLSRLHRQDWKALGLSDFGKPGSYFTRQIHRWTQQYRASETERIEAMEQLMAWLPEHIPADDQTTVVHGDFRLGNTIVHPREPRIVAVLDWEMGAIGDPRADVGYLLATYSEPGGPPNPLGTSPVTSLPGFPPRAELVERYVERSGRDVEPLAWFEALALWKAAVFCEAIYGRYVRGELGAEDERAARFEEGVPYLADAAAVAAGI